MAITQTRDRSAVHAAVMAPSSPPDPEVPEKASRRRFTIDYKLRILEEVDRATEPGAVGALLRREGLYSSHLVDWRRQRAEGTLGGRRPGRRSRHPLEARNEALTRENERLRRRLEQAETVEKTPVVAEGPVAGRTQRGPGRAALGAVRGCLPGRGSGHPARRGVLPVLDPNDVADPGRRR